MTGYINKFHENKYKNKNKITMSPMVKDKQLLKNHNKICIKKQLERLMSIHFDNKTTYSDDDKYIKKHMKTVSLQIFMIRKGL